MRLIVAGVALCVVSLGWLARPAQGQIAVRNQGFVPFSEEPINYRTAPVSDPVYKLQQRLNRGEVKLDDPVEKYLPQGLRGLKLRDHTGAPIQLVDLATHRSGLPRLPDNMPYGTRADPYADYREQELLQYLKRREELTASDGGKSTRKRDERYQHF